VQDSFYNAYSNETDYFITSRLIKKTLKYQSSTTNGLNFKRLNLESGMNYKEQPYLNNIEDNSMFELRLVWS
jgi:hypothetical protein